LAARAKATAELFRQADQGPDRFFQCWLYVPLPEALQQHVYDEQCQNEVGEWGQQPQWEHVRQFGKWELCVEWKAVPEYHQPV
jgi:hypothetical protein